MGDVERRSFVGGAIAWFVGLVGIFVANGVGKKENKGFDTTTFDNKDYRTYSPVEPEIETIAIEAQQTVLKADRLEIYSDCRNRQFSLKVDGQEIKRVRRVFFDWGPGDNLDTVVIEIVNWKDKEKV